MDSNNTVFESAETTETEEIKNADMEETKEDTSHTETESDSVSTDEAILGDVSSGEVHPDTSSVDISSGDVSAGDTLDSSGNRITPSVVYGIPETLEVTCTCHEEVSPLLWESDITQYSVTDGLLLLILITLVLDIVIFRRK